MMQRLDIGSKIASQVNTIQYNTSSYHTNAFTVKYDITSFIWIYRKNTLNSRECYVSMNGFHSKIIGCTCPFY